MGRNVLVWSSLLSLCLSFFAQSAHSKTLTFASLNIKFYGSSRSSSRVSNTPDTTKVQDPRDQALTAYIKSNLGDADVISFQEIVDKEAFKQNVLENRYDCKSYTRNRRGHIYTMICYKKHYRFVLPANDDDHVIQEVALGRRLRPAVHGILTDSQGTELAYVVAVHLKANPDKSETRYRQVDIMGRHMRKLKKRIPKIVLGDFNTFDVDVSEITKIMRHHRLGLKHVHNPNQHTFKVPAYQGKLDHFWVNEKLRKVGKFKTSKVCRDIEMSNQETEYTDLASYNKNISDHCYIKSTFEVLKKNP